ncbi:MAG TPA: hypothetical protein VIJ34_01850 [Acidimicrobiales bacterium]
MSAVAAAMSPNAPSAIDSGSTARSTLASVVAVTLKLPTPPAGRSAKSCCSTEAMLWKPGRS